MPADHSTICKFDSRDENCKLVLETISMEADRALRLNCSGAAVSPPPAASGNTHWIVPRSANALFTGRSDAIASIAKAITAPADVQRRFILTGMGGLGKSEMCLKVASRVREQYVLSSILPLFALHLPSSYRCMRYRISIHAIL